MSSNNGLIDALTLRQILVERYSRGEAIRLLKHLRRMSKALRQTINTDYGKARAVVLARQVESIATTYLTEYGDDLIDGLGDFAQAEAAFAQQAILATTAAEAVAPASIRQIQAAITRVPMRLISGKDTQSLTINQAVKTFTKNRAKEVGEIIRDGATSGQTSQQIVSQVTEIINGKITHQSKALVNTVTGHIGEQARQATYKANDDVVDRWEFVATLDGKTSISCASLDGTKYPLGKGPLPKIHWNCRSVATPVVNPKYNLGANVVGERATKDGPVKGSTTYGGWLMGQNDAVKLEVLGAKRAKLFKSGKLSIGKFTDDSGRVYTLEELAENNSLTFAKL